MSFANPTRLRIGMHGNFAGKDYRVLGRVVMGETEAGETYYWNEFNLRADDGSSADLVYEETERGGQWRMFTQFEPEYPLPAADAVTKHVGDHLNLTGDDVRVTFRGVSRVYRIEGQAPEGVEVGDIAEYFNAEAGQIMQVVSWTGDEVEFYNGVNLTSGMVAAAFNLRPEEVGSSGGNIFSSLSGSNSGDYTSAWKFMFQAGIVIVFFFVIFGRTMSCSTDYEASAVKNVPAGASPLTVGVTGKLADKNYRITAHALVQIAEVGKRWERHEYQLTDDNNMAGLLICGTQPGKSDWLCLDAFFPMLAPTAKQLAAKKVGDTIELDGYTGTIREIFLSTLEQTDGVGMDHSIAGTVTYGFEAQNEYRTLLLRWNSDGVQFFRGRNIDGKKLIASFRGASGQAGQ